MKLNPDPVFFISLVGVNEKGIIDEDEHIFDIYTKLYDFLGCDVKVLSAQDLLDFYKSKHTADDVDGADASGNPTVEHQDVPSLSSPTMAPTMSTSTIGNACGNTSTKEDAKGKFRFGVFVRGRDQGNMFKNAVSFISI